MRQYLTLERFRVRETYHVTVCLLTHETSECNDGRDAGEEEKDDGRQTLHVDTVSQHAGVHPRVVAVLHVFHHSSEKSVRQRRHKKS